MNALSKSLAEPMATPPGEEVRALQRAAGRRRLVVNILRPLILVVAIGGWQLGARLGIIDPFFWGQPSGVWAQIWTWVTEGTAQGPLWVQILVTLQEAVLGFLIGVVLGVIFGVVLGSNRFLSDVLGPYIKAANSIPRIVLGSLFV